MDCRKKIRKSLRWVSCEGGSSDHNKLTPIMFMSVISLYLHLLIFILKPVLF